MQHLEFNFVWRGTNCLVVTTILALAQPALAAKPDPLLDAGPTAPCAARVDYSGGADVNGNPVVPADVGAQHVPVPGTVMVPLPGNAQGNGNGRDSAYVALDGKKLDALVNPKPCK
jgi:hypothetical protein